MKQFFYKELDLFGNEALRFSASTKRKPDLFTDHDAFVEKFEPKKTTDDCYTPKEVFEAVVEYVNEHCDLSGKTIIRPFYPGGDFEAIEYPPNCVVVDNPPFSIISKIVRFYLANDVRFFLFAPHLTLFGSDVDCTHLVVGSDVRYENGAVVKTSFLSNMFGEAKIIGDAAFYQKLQRISARQKVNLPKYEYPDNVATVSSIQWLVEKGVSIRIDKKHTRHLRALEAQKAHGKGIFGSGFLLSDSAAAEKQAAEKQAAEKVNVITWPLSEKEQQIIKSLGQ